MIVMIIQTLNEWLKQYGYVWIDGQEHLSKSIVSAASAQVQIQQLLAKGVIKHA